MPKRALIVEDNPDLGAVLLEFLELLNYESELTQGVKESVRLLKGENLFDVLIIDYTLGDGTGIDIINWCKKRLVFKDLRFILISGYEKSRFASSLMQDPAVAFLQKPFTIAQLKETLG
jgi:DNA-binding NtrC family response regulator|tara:strand:- start:1232 stop:1588 length:357 start_codon:yes stop_codon:yes gene_type:complete